MIDFVVIGDVVETEEMRVQAHAALEQFVKNYVKKYKPLFRNGFFDRSTGQNSNESKAPK